MFLWRKARILGVASAFAWGEMRERKQKPRGEIPTGFLKNLAVPTFALVGTIIGLESLTTVFGMGTGVAFPVCSPEEDCRTVKHGRLGAGLTAGAQFGSCKSGAGQNTSRKAGADATIQKRVLV